MVIGIDASVITPDHLVSPMPVGGLGRPEGHLPGVVQGEGGQQFGAGLRLLSNLAIEYSEAAAAVGHERAHTELVGRGEGLTVVGCVLLARRRIAMHRDLALQGMMGQSVGWPAECGSASAPDRRDDAVMNVSFTAQSKVFQGLVSSAPRATPWLPGDRL